MLFILFSGILLVFISCEDQHQYFITVKFCNMSTKKTKTTETFIRPEQFDEYIAKGFVVFTERPTAFGTFKAIKIELVIA